MNTTSIRQSIIGVTLAELAAGREAGDQGAVAYALETLRLAGPQVGVAFDWDDCPHDPDDGLPDSVTPTSVQLVTAGNCRQRFFPVEGDLVPNGWLVDYDGGRFFLPFSGVH